MRLDYSNSYTIKGALRILEHELSLALKNQDERYAREVIHTAQQLYQDFVDMTAEPGFIEKVWIKRMKAFIAHITNKTKSEFNNSSIENQLKESIEETASE